MKPPAARTSDALRALRLYRKSIKGDELAHKLKVTPDRAELLVRVGELIERAESCRLKQAEFDALKIIVRLVARNTALGLSYTKTGEVDFAANKRAGWCARQLVGLSALGLVEMPRSPFVCLTRHGWCLAWEAGLIKPNWTVPA